MADGADAMQGRPARARKLPTWLKDSAVEDNTDPLSGERRVTGATHRAKKRKRADNLAVIGNADDSSDEGDVLYSGSGGEAGDSSDDVEEYGDQHSKPHAKPRGKQPPAKDVSSQAAAGLKALSAKEREHLSQRKRARKNEGTRTEYETRQQVFQRYLKNGRYEEGVGEIVIDPTEPTPEVMAEFVRFFQWYANGRKGDPVAGGRKPKGDQLGQSAMVSLHAALQDYVAVACEKQGKPVYKLAEQADYSMIYKIYCVSTGSRAEGNNSDYVHFGLTLDDYIRLCQILIKSAKKDSIRNLAVILYQFATVSRGDDVRCRHLRELMVRFLRSIGPSQCPSIAVIQPPAGGKTLGSRPAWKGMIRARLPECCPIRALFASIICDILLDCKPMPELGEDFLLFKGSNSQQMNPSTHAKIIKDVFEKLGLDTSKVTHEFRVFAAQAMHEMGVPLEVIQRIGHWLLDAFGTAYIVPGFTPEALLALGLWPGAAQKDFWGYWAERFHVAVPEELVYKLLPGLDRLEKSTQAAADKAASTKRKNKLVQQGRRQLQVLKMVVVVVVQDALELAEKYNDNPIHKFLLQQPLFKGLLETYKAFKRLGGFEQQRPLSSHQRMMRMQELLDQMNRQQLVRYDQQRAIGHTQLDWSAYFRLQAGLESAAGVMPQQQQQQQERAAHRWSPDMLQALQAVLSGKQPLSQRQKDIIAKQVAELEQELQEDSELEEMLEQQDSASTEHCVPGLSSGAAAAATGDDGVGTESDPEQQQETGDSPRQQLPAFGRSGHVLTPSGYSRPVPGLRGRSISTRSPGGEHYTTFFGVEEGQQAVQWARKQQQERQQQQRSRPPQTPCCSDAKLLESVQALLQQQSELVVHIRAICTSGGLATGQGRQNMHQQVEQLYHVTKQLQQLLAAAWDGPAVVADRGMGATTAGGTAAAGTEPAAAGATVAGQPAWVPTVLQQMGPQVDPISRMFHPHTSEAGTVVNWLHGAVQPGGDLASLPAAGVAQLFQMMMAQLQRVETKLPAIRDSGAAGTSAAAAQTAATVQLDVGAPSGGDSAAAAELTASTGACGAAKASKKAQGQLSFPNFGTVVTVVAAAKWYHKTPLPDHLTLLDGEDCKGLTPSQMQAKESCLQKWRGGTRGPRYQRWYEWVSLMKHVERKQVEMTAQQRKAVDVLIAAAEVDKVRGKESLYKLVKRLKPDGTLAATAAAGPDDGGEDDDIAGA